MLGIEDNHETLRGCCVIAGIGGICDVVVVVVVVVVGF